MIVHRTISGESRAFKEIAGLFYEFFSDKNVWVIRPNYGQARTLLKVFYYSAIVISTILFLVSRVLIGKEIIQTPFYPIFGIIIVGELFFFIDGLTKSEYLNMIDGENEDSRMVVDYSILRNVLRKLFGDKLSSEGTVTNYQANRIVTNDEIVEELLGSDNPADEAYGEFIKSMCRAGAEIDHNYVYSARKMLNGESVLFNNPFYNDLTPYAFYPMNRTLLRNKKVLVILGRHSIEEEIEQWLYEGFAKITNVPAMWEVGNLNQEKSLDVGVITKADIYNSWLLERKRTFLQAVEFIVIVEPSKLVTTAQVGLSTIIHACNNEHSKVVYCALDKNADGLVDALSHITMTDISEVSATNQQEGVTSYMCWNSDETHLQHRLIPSIARYLGFGTELAFVALKNQVSKAIWYGGEAFPVKDISWIARQYYQKLLAYAGLPTEQHVFSQYFQVFAGLWSAKKEKYNYLVVEDESCNLFEMLRNFSTRGKEQCFVNVISTEYMLKDYMTENADIFISDPKAIPYISADFARTQRNTILQLMLQLCYGRVNEKQIRTALYQAGIKVGIIKEDIWNIFTQYVEVPDSVKRSFRKSGIESITEFNFKTEEMEQLFYIKNNKVAELFINDLSSAYFITEDENGSEYYLGSELRGHIYQRFLPGQMFTYGGKSYEMMSATQDDQVIIRRAADHIKRRFAYRQVRNYSLSNVRMAEAIGDQKDVGGIHIQRGFADIQVATPAYYDMPTYQNFEGAKKVTINGVPERQYKSKAITKIRLPEATEQLIMDLSILLNETFKTIFAENHPFICAVPVNVSSYESAVQTYTVEESDQSTKEPCIYIIEDSQLDLGLLVAVERYLFRILEIICDYLEWNKDAIEKSKSEMVAPEEGTEESTPEAEKEPEMVAEGSGKKKGIIKRIKDFFKKRSRKSMESATVDFEIEEEEVRKGQGIEDQDEKAYHQRYYLLYGNYEGCKIDTENVIAYLKKLGFAQNALKQARSSRDIARQIEENYNPNKAGAHFCDFCGIELYGAEYEILADGRERCMSCGQTAVKTEKEFVKIFNNVLKNMESFYGIRFNIGIKVRMTTSAKLAKATKRHFVPTPGFDPRAVGVAIKDSTGYTIIIENGAPRINAMMTIAHELTHIWQYLNWDDRQIKKRYGKEMSLEIYEGMAVWAEIQYAMLINEVAIAKREEKNYELRNDAYGRGFVKFREKYPFSIGGYISKPTPFLNKEEPL